MSYNLVDSTTGDLTRVAGRGGTLYAATPIGGIIPFGSSTIPSGYLLCDGSAVSRTDYADLFTVIGTSFGAGDGSTTFNMPDMRELVPVGVGQNGTHAIAAHDTYTLGEFKDDQLQNHNHTSTPYINIAGGEYSTAYSHDTPTSHGGDVTIGRHGTTTHGKQIGVNYIIKAKHVGIPSDFIDAIDDVIADTTVDTVANGNLNPVTSNAVYDAIAPITAVTSGTITLTGGGTIAWYKYGRVVSARIAYGDDSSVPASGTLLTTLPENLRPVIDMNCKITDNGQTTASDISITTGGGVHLWYANAVIATGFSGAITYITAS